MNHPVSVSTEIKTVILGAFSRDILGTDYKELLQLENSMNYVFQAKVKQGGKYFRHAHLGNRIQKPQVHLVPTQPL